MIFTAAAPLAGLAHPLRDSIPVPLVERVYVSMKMAEALCALNPVTMMAGLFRRPAKKPSRGLCRALSGMIVYLLSRLASQNNYFGVLRDFGF